MALLIVVRGPIGVGKTSVAVGLRDAMSLQSSLVETDAIKRMIDPVRSSNWRRQIANQTAEYLVENLLKVPRTTIVEAHTKFPEVLDRYRAIASRQDARLLNVLLTAPIDVCLLRASQREVPGINYAIDEEMIRSYYCNLDPQSDDFVYDTTINNTSDIVDSVMTLMYKEPGQIHI